MPGDLTHTILVVHAASTWFMLGLIWFVQLVHYPLMAAVGPEHFAEYERSHQQRITPIVALAMATEAVTAGLIALAALGVASPLMLAEALPTVAGDPGPITPPLAVAGFALVVANFLSTFFLQVPLHARLQSGFDHDAWRRLVRTNWIRTIAWSARGVIAAALLA